MPPIPCICGQWKVVQGVGTEGQCRRESLSSALPVWGQQTALRWGSGCPASVPDLLFPLLTPRTILPHAHTQQTQGSEARLQILFWALGKHQPLGLGLLFLEPHQAVSILERTLERGRYSPVIQVTPESSRRSPHVHSPLPSQQILGCLGPSYVKPDLLPLQGLCSESRTYQVGGDRGRVTGPGGRASA